MFQKWMPAGNIGNAYDVENIIWGDPISFTLTADKNRVTQDQLRCFRLEWNAGDIISCNISDETYRADCWNLDFEICGRFYLSDHSDYIEAFRNRSPLFPGNVMHFLIVGTNTIIDVLAKDYPTVKIIE